LRLKALWVSILLLALLVSGCAGIEPYEPRNNREEGPQKGVFTGSEGEFVIFRKADELAADGEAGNRSDQNADGEQQEMDSEKKEEKIKKGGQQP
jgi:hypothetical protein